MTFSTVLIALLSCTATTTQAFIPPSSLKALECCSITTSLSYGGAFEGANGSEEQQQPKAKFDSSTATYSGFGYAVIPPSCVGMDAQEEIEAAAAELRRTFGKSLAEQKKSLEAEAATSTSFAEQLKEPQEEIKSAVDSVVAPLEDPAIRMQQQQEEKPVSFSADFMTPQKVEAKTQLLLSAFSKETEEVVKTAAFWGAVSLVFLTISEIVSLISNF